MALNRQQREDAEQMRVLLSQGPVTPAAFRSALEALPAGERDAWLDLAFGLEAVASDGPQLPVNCTPYLPAPVDAVLRAVDHTEMGAADVFVDVGSGVGRAALLAQLCTGGSAIGLEIQPALAESSLALARRLHIERFVVLVGDAPQVLETLTQGTVFFLYCPFGGERLQRTLAALAQIGRARPIHVCCVQLPPLAQPWLTPLPLPEGELAVYRSVVLER